MGRIARVAETTVAIAHTGSGVKIPPGEYEVVEIDGAAERGAVYVTGPDGDLVCVNPHDPAVTIEEDGR